MDETRWNDYRKKPVVVQAKKLTAKTLITTREGALYGYPGDYLIRGVQGEEYPCGADIFKQTYELHPMQVSTGTNLEK